MYLIEDSLITWYSTTLTGCTALSKTSFLLYNLWYNGRSRNFCSTNKPINYLKCLWSLILGGIIQPLDKVSGYDIMKPERVRVISWPFQIFLVLPTWRTNISEISLRSISTFKIWIGNKSSFSRTKSSVEYRRVGRILNL